MSAHRGTDGRARLMCNHSGCIEVFGRNHTSATATRDAARKAGWDVASRDDRRDFCPEHAGANR
ncbi:hypothetical protein [Microbacterium paraoxydans]|uniref:hypothetical protein n=1 Tax=Microbacterium paraoxydans TaxID=199592 RepID=UPI003D73EE2E